MYPALSDSQVEAVISAVEEFFGRRGVSGELVSVVVPVYFNSASLPRLAERLKAVAASADHDLEVIFVDDGSGDDVLGADPGDRPRHGRPRGACA